MWWQDSSQNLCYMQVNTKAFNSAESSLSEESDVQFVQD